MSAAVEALGASVQARVDEMHRELAAYKAWLEEQGVEVVPREEVLAVLQGILRDSEELRELVARADEATSPRMLALVQRIGLTTIDLTCRLRDERETKKKGLH